MHYRYLPSFFPSFLSSLSLSLSCSPDLSLSRMRRMEVLNSSHIVFPVLFSDFSSPLYHCRVFSLPLKFLWNIHFNGCIVFNYIVEDFDHFQILSITNNYNKEMIQRKRVWMVKENVTVSLKIGEFLIYSFHSFDSIACNPYLIFQLVYNPVIYLNGFTELTTSGILYWNNNIT